MEGIHQKELENVRYRYALTNGVVICVDELAPEKRANFPEFKCPACNSVVIARLGPVRVHHFAHKKKHCSYESYLHAVAKKMVYELFASGKRIDVERNVEVRCDHYRKLGIKECEREIKETICISDYFHNPSLEKGIDGVIADILVEAKSGESKLLVEIVVTHPCEPKKINLGHRILEISVQGEQDLQRIRLGGFSYNKRDKLHNFKTINPVRDVCKGECKANEIYYLHVRPSGKATLPRANRESVAKLIDRLPNQILKVWDSDEHPRRSDVIVETHLNLKPLKDCELCQFIRMRRPSKWENKRGFCTKRDHFLNQYQEALQCQLYTPDTTYSERIQRLAAIRKSAEIHSMRRKLKEEEERKRILAEKGPAKSSRKQQEMNEWAKSLLLDSSNPAPRSFKVEDANKHVFDRKAGEAYRRKKDPEW